MPFEVRRVYFEAKCVFDASPRAAAALIRLAFRVYCNGGGVVRECSAHDVSHINKPGLPEDLRKMLFELRVIGENAAAPGQIMSDDREMAIKLFESLNHFVDFSNIDKDTRYSHFQNLPLHSYIAIHLGLSD